MNKKILIGSIIAVVLLTLVSFSSVVGYSSVKSDSKIVSPLFGIRTNRAIDKEQDAVTSDYIGKGKAINILLPRRNDKADLIEKFVNLIKGMDEKSFDRFVDLFINHLHSRDDIQGYDDEEIILSLNLIRDNPKVSGYYLSIISEEEQYSTHLGTCNPTPKLCPLIFWILIFMIFIVCLPFMIILGIIKVFTFFSP